jgi:predicted methyltransferase
MKLGPCTAHGLGLAAALIAALALASPAGAAASADPALQSLVTGAQRKSAYAARDAFRHPAKVLHFFGLKPTDTVVEILPGGGYWTEILAPYLRARGHYIAALAPDDSSAEMKAMNPRFRAKLKADPALYSKVDLSVFDGDESAIAPPGSADLVVTFRNLHNWMEAGDAPAVLHAFYQALKPGGVLGMTDHRGRTDRPQDPKAKDGYVRQDYAVKLAEKAGFRLVASSEVNANPRDTKDYPAGVWTLPPTYRLGDKDRAKYKAIGESDVFVLKFVKPKD